jgi:5'-nucleotidase
VNILLSNDDGYASPLLPFAVDALQTLGGLTIVAPKEEQSGRGKALSCFQTLELSSAPINGIQAHIVTGTPADCVNIGIYHLCAPKPDLIVSGINMGINAGIGFVLASGTIGACLEANLAGIPAVALSQFLEKEAFDAYIRGGGLPEGERARLQQQTAELLRRVFQYLFADPKFLSRPITWNVNLPYVAADDCPLVPALNSRTTYGSWFKRSGDTFRHQVADIKLDTRAEADSSIVRRGHVSIAKLDLMDLAG